MYSRKLGKSSNLRCSRNRRYPIVVCGGRALILNDKLEVEWSQTGRDRWYYGDTELKMHLKCYGWITKLIKKFTALFN